jgi:hypothetical protein
MKLPATHPLHLALGLTLWLVWFAVVYGAQGAGCAVVQPAAQAGASTPVNVLLGGLTLAFFAGFAAAAALMARAARAQGKQGDPGGRFVTRAATALYATAAASTLVVGLPVFLMPPCV